MGLEKRTRIEDYRMIHTWDDVDVGFHIEASKRDGTWQVDTNEYSKTFDRYQNAVDWVMDEWRLAKAGYQSWEEPAAVMAADLGKEWESLSDDEAQDLIDAARSSARYGHL
jgi:hypothetical protein